DRKIHFTFTDGHPRNEKNNSIYYTYYENGAFYKANGKKIKNIADLPLKPEELDIVYDAKKGGAKAWNWDIAEDKK
ncbi:BNR-4 repeat-containing protein, partial [Halomonas marinisediminis]